MEGAPEARCGCRPRRGRPRRRSRGNEGRLELLQLALDRGIGPEPQAHAIGLLGAVAVAQGQQGVAQQRSGSGIAVVEAQGLGGAVPGTSSVAHAEQRLGQGLQGAERLRIAIDRASGQAGGLGGILAPAGLAPR